MLFTKRTFNFHFVFSAISVLLFIGFGFSEALISIGIGLLFLHSFFINHSELKQNLTKNKSFLSLLFVFVFFLVGALVTHDKQLAIKEINRNLFWILIPTGVALTPKINSKQFWNLLFFYVIIITLATFSTTINYFVRDYNLENFRLASLIRHSSLSIYSVFALFILIVGKIQGDGILRKIKVVPLIIWITWLFLFLSVQKSLLGIIALFAGTIVFLIIQIRRIANKRKKILLWSGLVVTVLFPIVYLSVATYIYYNTSEKTPNLNLKTIQGNSYSFDLSNKTKENGEYVFWYICQEEMINAWRTHFGADIFDETPHGDVIYDVAVRYLTSKGLKKDAAGIQQLTHDDFCNIKKGIANHIFVDKKYSFYPRVYQSIWELDVYFNSGDPNNKSLSQRIEYVKAAFYIIKNKPFGIGVGNCKIEYEKAFNALNSELKPEYRIEAHNQYMSYIVKFGVIGAIIVFALIFWPIFKEKKKKNVLLILFVTITLAVCIGDNFLELHSGLSFFAFFYSLIIWHSPT